MKIVKKKHWNNHSEPSRPRLPIEPKELVITSECIYTDTESINFSDIEIPNGYTANDLYFETEYDSYSIIVYLRSKVENKNYKKDFIKYNTDLVKFEEDAKNWDQDIIEYRAWKKQEDKELLEKQIKQAKDFLKKHDKNSK